ncbi:glycosyltransferase family 4 protein [Nonomuraea gerenzanensis]|uniref:Glycosyl transferase, group 1 n=1 Tax=Nonomuraea gerenzanensis TaxID=93944 RepID=A0A1M4EI44_9ACTN|nr:glycosyltransferase family 4 protein [Nonomuraea gerenzanensis]UBU09795.1 glycosyltransferase family 4 protein [Nonomuraea gerenzanensis]SBO98243.1 glycosyl transferase, group 1 [Nonomuraea gerenzanensis]
MRVAFVLGTTSGGTGRHVLMLVAGLVRRGHQVLVAGPGSVEEQFSFGEAGARFVEVPVSDRPDPVNDLRAVLAIRRLTRGADVVHAHGLRAGALAALGRRGPVVTLHNALTAGGFVGVVYGVLERIVARRAGQVLTVSPDLGERMRRLGARDVRAALIAAPAPRPATRTAQEVRDELGAGDRPIVLTVARLAQQKGLETLLDVAAGPWRGGEDGAAGVLGGEDGAAEALKFGEDAVAGAARGSEDGAAGTRGSAAGPVEALGGAGGPAGALGGAGRPAGAARESGGGPLFVVAGEGPLRGELQRRIDAEGLPVVLLGNRDDVPDLLGAAEVLLMPSRWEGQPLTLREALMTGTPAIASDVGGIPEILGDAGILVPYGDVERFRAAVRELLETPGAARTLAEAAERRGREMPGEDEAVASALGVYRA